MLNKMKLRKIILLASVVVVFAGCEKVWEDHYNDYPETVDQNVWEAMQNDSTVASFVRLLKEYHYDTLFQTKLSYTVFAPTNDALQQFLSINEVDSTLLKYHLSTHFIQSGNVEGKRKIRTLSKKYALFEKYGSQAKLDGILINFESPLYKNGKFFILNQVDKPIPNLYEFYANNNEILKQYIDSQDSIVLDNELSTPIGFDQNGNTIYDTVSYVFNKFEEEYFPVSEEFRNRAATIVFPLKEDYENALTEMAGNLGNGYTDYRDIPEVWQQEVLVPFLLKQGVFENKLEPEEFLLKPGERGPLMLKNILGDSIEISYTPVDKSICSNGYAYNYQNFKVPDSLYSAASRFEVELLLEQTGINKYAWGENAVVNSDKPFQPYKEYVASASNDTIETVLFPDGYSGNYSLEFNTQNLFPRKYVMIVNTHMDVGGIYDIYVNDELVKTFDYYDFVRYRGIMPSVTGGRYVPTGRFNSFDMYVDNITEFSKAKIKFVYKGPGNVTSNGLVLDYIDFLPVN